MLDPLSGSQLVEDSAPVVAERLLAIIPFKTRRGNTYVYDDNTGMVFPVTAAQLALLQRHTDEPLDEALEHLAGSHSTDDLRASARWVEHWERLYGAFYRPTAPPESVARAALDTPEEAIAQYLTSGGGAHLVLILSEDCNLRCRYCYYSEAYGASRNRTSRAMSSALAFNAIDGLFARTREKTRRAPTQRLAITFYGGEPLLAQKTLRDAVLYAEARTECELVFSVTTNGTLLHGSIAEFLVQKNFGIIVSLDGNESNHDRNRVFPDGTGSFAAVEANLREFRTRFPDYPRIHLACVVDWRTSLTEVARYFGREAWLPSVQLVSQVNDTETSYYSQFDATDLGRFRHEHQAITRHYRRRRKQGQEVGNFARLYSESALLAVVLRKRTGNISPAFLPFTATCIPGHKVAVRPDGTYDVCERVNGTRPIGSVQTGLDVRAIAQLLHDYKANVCAKCWTCPMSKLCSRCIANSNIGNTFALPEGSCEAFVEQRRYDLALAYTILEANPGAFDDLSHINRELRFVAS